jgi:hypothetical protein
MGARSNEPSNRPDAISLRGEDQCFRGGCFVVKRRTKKDRKTEVLGGFRSLHRVGSIRAPHDRDRSG